MKINTFVKKVNKLGRHDEIWLQKLDKETGFVSNEVYLGDAQFISEEDVVLAMKKLNMTINDDNFDLNYKEDMNRQILRNTNKISKITALEYSIYDANSVTSCDLVTDDLDFELDDDIFVEDCSAEYDI